MTSHRLRWWREGLYVLAFYEVYSVVRNTQGSAAVSAAHAFRNARRVIRFEQLTGLYHERSVQQAFLDDRWFVDFWNLFYGTFHFVVTIGALVVLFSRFRSRYPLWRNTLACTTAVALVGFVLFPLMPPRLLPSSYGFVDTLKTFGSLWSFDSGAMNRISNQYAAMPSLHFAWAVWSAVVLVPLCRHMVWKLLAAAYPLLTLFAVVVTANHFLLDAVGGAFALGTGYLVAAALTGRVHGSAPPPDDVTPAALRSQGARTVG